MEPWELKTEEVRSSDTITNFLLFCEGENSEPLYFKHFETFTQKIKVNTLGNWKSGSHNVNKSIHHCCEENLTDIINGVPHLRQDVKDNIWCVYDRDLENTNLIEVRPHDDYDFTHSISTALNAGLNVAWSNDAFEVWMLLHFEKIPTGARLHRNHIYERLTEIYKTLQPRTPELDKITSNPRFNFKDFSKRELNFITYIRPRLMERTQIAIQNATELELINQEGAMPYHNQNPGTTVHHLIVAIQTASL